jgi:NAD(P)-dependent dehydrogenase (short-subunit alcohol dehydrogenase family)
VAVVTGGGQNIGKEISRALVRSGASVVILDRNPVTCLSSAVELQVGRAIDCGPCDVPLVCCRAAGG